MSDLMQIHQVLDQVTKKWDIDPILGMVQRETHTLRPTDAKEITHGGKSYKRQKDGSFMVPAELGLSLLRRNLGFLPGPGIDELPTGEELAALMASKNLDTKDTPKSDAGDKK